MRLLPGILLFASFCTFVPEVHGQEDERDPLQGEYRIADAADLLTLWVGEPTGFALGNQINHKFHTFLNLNNPDPEVLDHLEPGNKKTETGDAGADGDKHVDMIVGDLDGDDVDDIVSAWEGPDRSVGMVIPNIDAGQLDWSESNFLTLDGVTLVDDPAQTERHLALASGYFDDDPEEEFVLAYWGEDGAVHLKTFDTNGTLTPQETASAVSVALPDADAETRTQQSGYFDVATGDLNGDGVSEILVVAGVDLECSESLGCWQVVLRVYEVDPASGAISELPVPSEQAVLWEKTDNSNRWIGQLVVAAGDMDNDGVDEIAAGFQRRYNTVPQGEWFLRTLKMTPELDGFDAELGVDERIDNTAGDADYELSIDMGDLDGDADEEIVLLGRGLFVFDTDSTLQFDEVASHFDTGSDVVVADLDADNDIANESADWSPEIVMVHSESFFIQDENDNDGRFAYTVLKYTPGESSLEVLAELNDEVSEYSSRRPLALVAGNFGGGGLRVGSPQRYTRTDIVEPLVILNAPPTHFDVFGEEAFDITQCYNDNECTFFATYETETAQTIAVETEFHRDWSVGASVDGGFSIPIINVGVQVHLETKYGEGFSRREGTRETVTVSQTVNAIADDWIYAVIVDYDIWEYPLLLDGEVEGYVAIVVPNSRQRAWFDSKSFSAYSYIPSHEVGNVLSYPDIAAPEDNPALDVAVRWNTGDRITLNNNSNATWTLTSETETETTTQNSDFKSIGGSVDFNVPFKFIPDFGISGDYSETNVSTYTSRVTDRKGLSVHFEGIDLSVGNTRYSVTPYAYWATNGALVLDYAVRPELPVTGADPSTWWSETYGQQSDPAFILPWRNDPEKGLGISEEAQRFRTRDIVFDPAEPMTGDEITIKARIQNFSLLPTQGPVEVRFYVGDPDAGGTPIVGTGGEEEVFTESGITPRGGAVVELDWVVPSDVPRLSRIYAVVDPVGDFEEIHEDNNKAWTVLFVEDGIPTAIDEEGESGIPTEFALRQNYPNPFNPTTTIGYALPRDSEVRLTVFDLVGREVAVLVDTVRPAGEHTVGFEAAGLPSGIYFSRLEAGDFVQTTKMLLVR